MALCKHCHKPIVGKRLYHELCKTEARRQWAKRRNGTKKPRWNGWTAYGLPQPEEELVFHPTRKWRLDWGWPAWKLGVEQDGGLFIRGRHSRGAGRLGDYEKARAAIVLGWRVGRFSPQEIRAGSAAMWV